MIFASSKGSNIAGALRYVEGPGRDQVEDRAKLLGGDGFGFEVSDERTAEIAKRLMIQNGRREFQGEKDKYCTKDCLHLSLSWDPSQELPDVIEKRETARKFLKALGMENSMHMIYEHSDKRHPHIHIVASRVDPETGMAYDDYKRVEKGLQCALDKEREDEFVGKRSIPKAKKQLHAERAQDLVQGPEPSRGARRESVRGLYKAYKEEKQSDERGVSGLYRAHEREKERQMVDDGVGGRWAEDSAVQDLYKAHERERQKERQQVRRAIADRVLYGKMEKPSEKQVERVGRDYGVPQKERKHYYPRERQAVVDRVPRAPAPSRENDEWVKAVGDYWAKHHEERRAEEKTMVQDNDKWMKPLVDVWQKNREEKLERDQKHDRRIARGDDYAGDAWRSPDGKIKMVAVGHDPSKEAEPKRSITDRIVERAPAMGKIKEIEREREL